MKTKLRLAAMLLALLCLALPAAAVTNTWSGAGTNNNWGNVSNWVGNTLPLHGSDLVFPAGAIQRTNNNNYAAGTDFNSITISDTNYILQGNRIVLLSGLRASPPPGVSMKMQLPLTLGGAQVLFSNLTAGTLSVEGLIDTAGLTLNLGCASGATLFVQGGGSITGSGPIIKTGAGTAIFATSNSITGPATVSQGVLDMRNVSSLGASASGTTVASGGQLQVSGNFTLTEPLVMNGNLTLVSGVVTNAGPFTLNSTNASISVVGGPLVMASDIVSGVPGAAFTKSGAGSLVLNGASAQEKTTIIQGTVFVNGSQPSNQIVLSGGTLAGTGTVSTITTTPLLSGFVSPGASTGILSSSNVSWNATTVFTVELNGTTPGSSHDQLDVHGSVVLGNATLSVSIGYTALIGDSFKIINNDGADGVANTFLGLPQNGMLTNGTTVLRISYVGGDGNDVVLTVASILPTGLTRVWSGLGTNGFWSNPSNWVGIVTPQSGDALQFPVTATKRIATNDFASFVANTIQMTGSNLLANFDLRGAQVDVLNGVTAGTDSLSVFTFACPVRLQGPQTFAVSLQSSLQFQAQVDNNGYLLTTTNVVGGTLVFQGPIVGAGGLKHFGAGAGVNVALSGTNTFTGPLTVISGRASANNNGSLGASSAPVFIGSGADLQLIGPFALVKDSLSITGSVTTSSTNSITGAIDLEDALSTFAVSAPGRVTLSGPVTGSGVLRKTGTGMVELRGTNTFTGGIVAGNGLVLVNGLAPFGTVNVVNPATLGGTGVVGHITMASASPPPTISPGNSPGILTASNVALSAFGQLIIEINSLTPGTGHDQLVARGSVDLGGAALVLSLGFTQAVGTAVTIINNDGIDAVTNTFGGLPEGATITTNGVSFRVSYMGGTGNDVTLTRIIPPTGITRVWSGAGMVSLWNVTSNWVGNVVPGQGDDLEFPESAALKSNTNNFTTGTIFNSIRFSGSGYSLGGNALTLNAGVLADPAATGLSVSLPITLGQNQTFSIQSGVQFLGTVNLAANILTLNGAGTPDFAGIISGSGRLIQNGAGTTLLRATNTYTGVTAVNTGTVQILSSLSLGDPAAPTSVADGARLILGFTTSLVAEPLSLAGTLVTSNGNHWTIPISIIGSNATIDVGPAATFTLDGLIPTLNGGNPSNVATLTKISTGSLVVNATNPFPIPITVKAGTLFVNGSLPGSPITLDHSLSATTATLGGTGTVGSVTAINADPKVINPGFGGFAASGILRCGDVALNGSTTVQINMHGALPGSGYDQLAVTGTVNLGGAFLTLLRTFTPTVGQSSTIIDNDGADSVFGTFNGLPEGGTFSDGGVIFSVSYTGGDGNDVTLTHVVVPTGVASVWDGGGSNALWSNPTNWVGDVLPQPGDALAFPLSAARMNNTNDFAAGTIFDAIQFATSGYTLNGNAVTLLSGIVGSNLLGGNSVKHNLTFANGGTVTQQGAGQISIDGSVTLFSNVTTLGSGTVLFSGHLDGPAGITAQGPGGVILNTGNFYGGATEIQGGRVDLGHFLALGSPDTGTTVRAGATLALSAQITVPEPLVLEGLLFNSADSNTWSGPISLAGGNVEITVDDASLSLSGVISGTNGFTKRGTEPLRLTGTNSFSGDTRVAEGVLRVDGPQPSSRILLAGGILSGTGRVGEIVESTCGGTVSPGASPGILTCSNLLLGLASTVVIEINGIGAGIGYDQLNVLGSVSLGNAALNVSLGFIPSSAASFVTITNNGPDAVAGTFAGLPEGAAVGATGLTISYHGGSGNDVVLTAPCGPPPAPVNLHVAQLGPEPSRVAIFWDAVVPPCGPAIKEYILFRDGFEVARNTSPAGVDAAMIAGHTYTFSASCVNTAGVTSASSTGLVVTALPPNPIVGTNKVVNLLVRFSDFTDEPFPPSHADDVMFNGSNSVRAFYEENSYGKFSLTGTSYGWFTLPRSAASYCTLFLPDNPEGYSCDIDAIRSDTLSLLPTAISNEVNAADIVQLLVHGMGTVGLSAGKFKYYSATNGFSHGTVIHEISHGLNALLHAGSWEQCDLYTVGPDLLNLSAGGCDVFRYGDWYDPLGGGLTFHHNAWSKEKVGWLGPSNIVTITTNGEYLINRLETPSSGPQVLKYDLGNDMFYFIEYRTPTGFDGPSSPGIGSFPPIDRVLVRLRVSRPPGTDDETLILPRAFNGPSSFLDPYRGLLIDLISKSNGVARVRVTTGVNYAFRITDLHRTGFANSDVSLTWNSVPGLNYKVEGSTDLLTWQELQTFIFGYTTSTATIVNNAGTNAHRFFRLSSYPEP